MRWRRMIWVVVCICSVAWAAGEGLTPAQRRLAAERVARLDAMRKLIERVYGLNLTAETKVRDFALDSDQIKADARAFVEGVKEIRPPRHFADGTCELTVEITIQQVVENLKKIKKEKYEGKRFAEEKFENVEKLNDVKVIQVTGVGSGEELSSPNAEKPEDKRPDAAAKSFSSLPSKTAGIPGWENVTGRQRLLAERAAALDAYRKLAERVYGTNLTSETTVRDFVTKDDRMKADLEKFIQGVRIEKLSYLPGGIVEAEGRLTLRQLMEELKRINEFYLKEDQRIPINTFEQARTYYQRTEFVEYGYGTVSGAPAPTEQIRTEVVVDLRTIPPGELLIK